MSGHGDYKCETCGERRTSPRVWLTGAHKRVARCLGWYVVSPAPR